MADGTVFTGDTGVGIDNTLVGTTVYRQRIVIGSDATSSGFVNPSSVWPSSGTIGLPVRVIGSSGIVLGMVAPSSVWTVTTTVVGASSALVTLSSGTAYVGTVVSATSGIINLSTTSIVGLTTTATVGLTTTSVVSLSSSVQNYVTNSTTVPIYLSSGSLYLGVVVSATSGLVQISTASVQNIGTNTSTGATVLISTASVVGLTTTATVALTTANTIGFTSATLDLISNTTGNKYLAVRLTDGSTFYTAGAGGAGSTLVSLSSGTAYVGVVVSATSGTVNLASGGLVVLSSGTAQIGILGPSSANVIGIVAQSSNWNISTGAILSLSSALSNYITNSTTVPVYLGASTSNIVGVVGISSAVTLSSGALYVGTVVSASSGLVYFSTTTTVGITTSLNTTLSQTTAGAVASSGIYVGGGIVASTANTNTTISSGGAQTFQVDRSGALTVNLEGPRQFIKTANLVTVANTCFQQLIPTPGASLVTDLISLVAFSTVIGGSTTLPVGIITVLSSCGQQDPGIWKFKMFFWNQYSTAGGETQFFSFPIPLTQLTSNNAWGILSTGQAINVSAQYVVGTS